MYVFGVNNGMVYCRVLKLAYVELMVCDRGNLGIIVEAKLGANILYDRNK